jgi:hypothetical protein
MEKEFVPYELALRMKQLGFDEPCLAYYQKSAVIGDDTILPIQIRNKASNFNDNEYSKMGVPFCSAPTFSQAFRWFREKYDCIGFIYQPNETGYWAYSLEDKAKYDTYEEAELACLDKLIEVVEQIEKVEHGVYR